MPRLMWRLLLGVRLLEIETAIYLYLEEYPNEYRHYAQIVQGVNQILHGRGLKYARASLIERKVRHLAFMYEKDNPVLVPYSGDVRAAHVGRDGMGSFMLIQKNERTSCVGSSVLGVGTGAMPPVLLR